MKFRIHDYLMWLLLIIVGAVSWWVNFKRTEAGFFTDPTWIFWDGFMYTLFSALIVGYVVAKLLGNGKVTPRRKRD